VIFFTVPATGNLFTWTLKIDMKILILRAGLPNGLLRSSRCLISNMVPSAGVNIEPGAVSFLRSGSLKKNMMKRVTIPVTIEAKKNPIYIRRKVRMQPTNVKGTPSLASGHLLLICALSNSE